jgi:hypothetical protein
VECGSRPVNTNYFPIPKPQILPKIQAPGPSTNQEPPATSQRKGPHLPIIYFPTQGHPANSQTQDPRYFQNRAPLLSKPRASSYFQSECPQLVYLPNPGHPASFRTQGPRNSLNHDIQVLSKQRSRTKDPYYFPNPGPPATFQT